MPALKDRSKIFAEKLAKLFRNKVFLVVLLVVLVTASVLGGLYFRDQRLAKAADFYTDTIACSNSTSQGVSEFDCQFEYRMTGQPVNIYYNGVTTSYSLPEPAFSYGTSCSANGGTESLSITANVGDTVVCNIKYHTYETIFDDEPGNVYKTESTNFPNNVPGQIYVLDGATDNNLTGGTPTLCGNAADFALINGPSTFIYNNGTLGNRPHTTTYSLYSLSCTFTITNTSSNIWFFYSPSGSTTGSDRVRGAAYICINTNPNGNSCAAVSSERILDCRLPPADNPSETDFSLWQNVPPIIVPNYAEVGNDIFGLTMDADSNLYVLNGPSRSIYGGGVSGVSTQDALYESPISMTRLTPSTVNKNVPGSTNVINIPGLNGRPMDLDMKSFKGTDDNIYVYGLYKVNSNPLVGNSDVAGDVAGFIAVVNRNTGSHTLLSSDIPAGGYEKAFADIAVNSTGQVFFDDVRVATTPTNIYSYQPRLQASGTVDTTFMDYTDNTFFDVAADNTGSVYSLFTGGTDIYKDGARLNFSLPENSDGGDIEIADADDTYETTMTGDNYIYYTAGNGSGSGPALVRISQTGTPEPITSNSDPVDSNFTAENVGRMDKVILDLANQVIYYKNGSRTGNNPDQTIGKIYCPDPVTTPPNYTPPPLIPNPTTPGGDPGQGVNFTGGGGGSSSAPSSVASSTPSSTPTSSTPSSSVASSTGTPNLTLVKSSNRAGTVLNSGQSITYTLTVGNSGGAASLPFVVNDNLPAEVTFSGVSSCTAVFPSGITVSTCSYDSTNRRLSWNISSLPAGSSGSVSFGVVVN